MDRTKIAKAVVNSFVGFGVSATTGTIVRNNIPRHSNPAVDAAIGVSIYLTSMAVAGTIKQPVRDYTDAQIDHIAEAFDSVKSEIDAIKK